jgi:hypothetical protein
MLFWKWVVGQFAVNIGAVPSPYTHAIRKQAAALGLKRPPKERPKLHGTPWEEAEHALVRAYAAAQLSYADLQAQLPGRTWDGIEHHARVLGLRLRHKPVYYWLVPDVREIVFEEDPSKTVW